MHRIQMQQRFNTSPAVTFAALTDHVGLGKWLNASIRIEREGVPAPNGLGAVRAVRSRGLTVREEVVRWDAPHAMDYRVLTGAPLRNHLGEIRITAEAGGSLLDYRIRFDWPWYVGGGLVGRRLAATLEREIGGGLARMAAAMG